MRTALFDADVLGYRFGHSGTHKLDFGAVTAVEEDPDDACAKALEHIEEVVDEVCADDIVLCWSDPTDHVNWRLDVLSTYKHNRDPSTRPNLYHAVRSFLTERFRTYWRPRLEADDVMGILATHPKIIPGKKIVVTVDKDLLQVPGLHFNPGAEKRKRRRRVERVDGDYWHMLQTLAGDAVDGYDGIPGIGLKKAEAILTPAGRDPGCMWELVVRAYDESGQFPKDPEGAALVTARVARILQHDEYDYKRKRPILWQPPS